MSNSRPRRDGDRRPSDRGDRGDRRDSQPDEEQQRRPGDLDLQESDSLTALKAILGKVAGLLTTLQLTQDECTSLVEQMYGSVLDMDLKLAGETDDKRKTSIQAHIQNTAVTRSGGKLVVEYPKADAPQPAAEAAPGEEAPVAERPAVERPRVEKTVAPAPVAEPETPTFEAVPEPVQTTFDEAMAPPAADEPAPSEAADLV